MASLNRAQIIGNLGKDPEVRSFSNGGKVVNLSVATTEKWRDRNTNEVKEATQWHSVAIFAEGPAKIAEQYLRKGSRVMIEGKIETRKWQDQSGNDRYTTEIVVRPYGGTILLLDGRRDDGGSRDGGQGGGYGAGPAPGGDSAPGGFDDDIPF